MQKDFFLHHLTPTDFERLTSEICVNWLGEGTTPFADGRDGGRDARFHGKAQLYPSTVEPWNGHIVIQAKHTATPNASCSDSDFQVCFGDGKKSECPKIENLIGDDVLDFYLVFTNRKLTAGSDKKILKKLKDLGVKDASVIGLEKLNEFLRAHPAIARKLPTQEYHRPFEFNPDDMVDVITAVHSSITIEGSTFSSEDDFENVNKKSKKNKANKMSDSYFQNVIVNEYMPLFSKLRAFLQSKRNQQYTDQYHDTANELRQKILVFRDRFDAFEEVMLYLYDQMVVLKPELKRKRRYVTFLLSYMYYDCDIGERETTE